MEVADESRRSIRPEVTELNEELAASQAVSEIQADATRQRIRRPWFSNTGRRASESLREIQGG